MKSNIDPSVPRTNSKWHCDGCLAIIERQAEYSRLRMGMTDWNHLSAIRPCSEWLTERMEKAKTAQLPRPREVCPDCRHFYETDKVQSPFPSNPPATEINTRPISALASSLPATDIAEGHNTTLVPGPPAPPAPGTLNGRLYRVLKKSLRVRDTLKIGRRSKLSPKTAQLTQPAKCCLSTETHPVAREIFRRRKAMGNGPTHKEIDVKSIIRRVTKFRRRISRNFTPSPTPSPAAYPTVKHPRDLSPKISASSKSFLRRAVSPPPRKTASPPTRRSPLAPQSTKKSGRAYGSLRKMKDPRKASPKDKRSYKKRALVEALSTRYVDPKSYRFLPERPISPPPQAPQAWQAPTISSTTTQAPQTWQSSTTTSPNTQTPLKAKTVEIDLSEWAAYTSRSIIVTPKPPTVFTPPSSTVTDMSNISTPSTPIMPSPSMPSTMLKSKVGSSSQHAKAASKTTRARVTTTTTTTTPRKRWDPLQPKSLAQKMGQRRTFY